MYNFLLFTNLIRFVLSYDKISHLYPYREVDRFYENKLSSARVCDTNNLWSSTIWSSALHSSATSIVFSNSYFIIASHWHHAYRLSHGRTMIIERQTFLPLSRHPPERVNCWFRSASHCHWWSTTLSWSIIIYEKYIVVKSNGSNIIIIIISLNISFQYLNIFFI